MYNYYSGTPYSRLLRNDDLVQAEARIEHSRPHPELLSGSLLE